MLCRSRNTNRGNLKEWSWKLRLSDDDDEMKGVVGKESAMEEVNRIAKWKGNFVQNMLPKMNSTCDCSE